MNITAERLAELRQMPNALRWVIAARLKTVGLSLTPVLCGSWLAAQQLQVSFMLVGLALLSAVAIQVGTNLWNDAADAERGTDTSERLGPPRMTALGLLDAPAVKAAAFFAFAVALLAGLPLAIAGGWPIVAVGVASLALGYAYSMGPLPLSHTPLGELIVILFFGVIAVTGTVHVLGGDLSPQSFLAGLMMGLPSSAVLLLNNHRDRKTDAKAGRRTLAILLGETGARLLYAVLVCTAVVCLVLLQPMTIAAHVLQAVALFAALGLAHLAWHTPVSAQLNRLLPLTVLFQFGLLLVLVVVGLLPAGPLSS